PGPRPVEAAPPKPASPPAPSKEADKKASPGEKATAETPKKPGEARDETKKKTEDRPKGDQQRQ
ncbi:MAG: hypothetical protein M3R22_01540, partial [Pseudomonadota bacterium]|nr:hypothetical protein [Pseudomonadota bacterium]